MTFHIGEKTIHLDEFLGKKTDIDFMFFTTDFILGCLKDGGFEKIEIIEREPYPGVEYESRRAYVFAKKPVMSRGKRLMLQESENVVRPCAELFVGPRDR